MDLMAFIKSLLHVWICSYVHYSSRHRLFNVTFPNGSRWPWLYHRAVFCLDPIFVSEMVVVNIRSRFEDFESMAVQLKQVFMTTNAGDCNRLWDHFQIGLLRFMMVGGYVAKERGFLCQIGDSLSGERPQAAVDVRLRGPYVNMTEASSGAHIRTYLLEDARYMAGHTPCYGFATRC